MGQKSSDFITIPLCRVHHQEQHRIGWPKFIQTYGLDVPYWLSNLTEKPKVIVAKYVVKHPVYVGLFRNQSFHLRPVSDGLRASIRCLLPMCREYLITELFKKEGT